MRTIRKNYPFALALLCCLVMSGCAVSEMESTKTETSTNLDKRDQKALIVYFTQAENSANDVVSSASTVLKDDRTIGRVEALAEMIHEACDADVFSIKTMNAYPNDMEGLLAYAAEEQKINARPEILSNIDQFDTYDIVFVGYPNWWYDMPMAMYTFFEQYDFSQKTIIPFNVHNGSEFSDTITTIKQLEPNAKVIENGFTVKQGDVLNAQSDVSTWLHEIGF